MRVRTFKRLLTGLTLALPCLAAGAAFAAPGDLDGSFGAGGKALADFGGNDYGRAVALQPDGKVVVAGFTGGTESSDFAVARLLNPQGTLDPSFGDPGEVGRSALSVGGADIGYAVALQPDGRIVVAGSTRTGVNTDFAVVRMLNPQGTFDPSFGDGTGKSVLGSASTDDARAMALQPDGKIVLAGSSNFDANYDFALMRTTAAGNLDGSFNDGPEGPGRSFEDFGGEDRGEAVALQPDGKIVVAGHSVIGDNLDFAVTRLLNPEAAPDPSFGGGTGKARVNVGGSFDAAETIVLQPDGKIVLVGASNVGGKFDISVVRLLPGGGLDSSFAGDGRSSVSFTGPSGADAVALQPDGKIIVAGTSGENMVAARLQPNGLLDTTFGNQGKSVIDFGGFDSARGLALQRDGGILLAGESSAKGTADFAVARLQGDPGGAVGGGGAGTTRCAGRRATIVGTPGNDRLKGTRRRDVIVSGGGKDSIKAGRGADIVCAGRSNDRVRGGAGNDRLFGQSGRDRLGGDSGNDRLSGGSGRDRLSGGRGRDRLRGGRGKDRLRGGPGKDRVRQ